MKERGLHVVSTILKRDCPSARARPFFSPLGVGQVLRFASSTSLPLEGFVAKRQDLTPHPIT
jgi:hypothetical protein